MVKVSKAFKKKWRTKLIINLVIIVSIGTSSKYLKKLLYLFIYLFSPQKNNN